MGLEKAKKEIRAAMEAHKAEGGTFARGEWGIGTRVDGELYAIGPVCAVGAWIARQNDARAEALETPEAACRRIAAERLGLSGGEIDDITAGFDDDDADALETSATPYQTAGTELAIEFVGPLREPYDDEEDGEDPEAEDFACDPGCSACEEEAAKAAALEGVKS